MTPKKPMLACDAPADLQFPLIVSPKLDGIRCTVWPDKPLTRSLKDIPNRHVRGTLQRARMPAVFDGELVVGAANHPDVYRSTTSGVMSHEGQPDFSFHVFDWVPVDTPSVPFSLRLARLQERTSTVTAFHPWFKLLEQVWINNLAQLVAYEAKVLADGYEGLITRHPDGVYKHGRSTAKEQGMLKVKRFKDTELEVVGTVEMLHNQNEATLNELGHTQRSSAKAGKVASGMLGALVCRWEDTTVEVGTGFTQAQRIEFWQRRDELVGQLAKVKYFEQGMKDKPRHPVWLGWRDRADL
uniref:Putative DNA ligase domain protein n=1 Tax=viral metagenome TaxID=1070528 RepID=A0A6M3MK56_9ZZZZ